MRPHFIHFIPVAVMSLTFFFGLSISPEAWARTRTGSSLKTCSVSGITKSLNGVWGNGPNNVWVVGEDGMALRFNGKTWSKIKIGTTENLNAIWGHGPTQIWIAGKGIPTWDGRFWHNEPMIETDYMSVWGSGPHDVFLVGEQILHCKGGCFGNFTNGNNKLNWVWGSGPKDVWAVGQNGMILHWDGKVWKNIPSGVTSDLLAIWGSGKNAVWAVGATGTILRWNGRVWRSISNTVNKTLYAIWG